MHKSLLVVSFFLLCSFQVSVESLTDMMVMKAAESQLGVYTSKILPGDAGLYGFRNEDDMELLTIGKPYRILEFNEDFYYHDLEEDHNYIDMKQEWRVPVQAKGVNRVLLTVKGNSSNYSVTAMGDTLLAHELQHKESVNDSDEYYLLRVPALSADFFVHEAHEAFDEAVFIPLANARKAIPAFGKDHTATYGLIEVQKQVKAALAAKAKKADQKDTPKQPARKGGKKAK